VSATITLKNIPDAIYAGLKDAAAAHHRSINSEVIACLEKALLPATTGAEERLRRARLIRNRLDPVGFDATEIAGAIRQGRA
jgi:plasmid stability protein